MKIALVTPYDYPFPGGVTEHVLELDREFRRRGHDTRILAASSHDDASLDANVIKLSGAVSTFPFSGSNVRVTISPQVYQRVKNVLRRERFDVIHAHEPAAPPLGPIVLHHSQAVTVGTFHAFRERNTAYQIARPLLAPFYKKLDGRVFVSRVVRDFTLRQFPGAYRIIPNGIDLDRFGSPHIEPLARFDDGRPNILFVGRLDKRKGLAHLLRAFPHIRHEFPDARLIVVGAFGEREKEAFLRYTRCQRIRGVHFVGYVSRQDLPRYYRTASLFCAPSTGFESFGMVLLEAMASGVPIVASDIAGYRLVLTDNHEGSLVPSGDPDAIARASIKLLRDGQTRERMGRAGRVTAARYDWAYVADALLAYYEELLTLQRHRVKQAPFLPRKLPRPSWGVFE